LAITYRPFRNPDPPSLVRIWNDCYTGRGAAFLNGSTPLEFLVLAKPYFERAGLILALDEGNPIGFVHAGFGPDPTGQRLKFDEGVICALAVRPSHRRRGIGRELLRQAEAYLKAKGAKTAQAGTRRPLHPFYWGLHGGSEPAGILVSDPGGGPAFLKANRYQLVEQLGLYDRELGSLPPLADTRFPNIKRKCELRILPRPVSTSWFEEAVYSPLEMLEFQLQENATGKAVARAKVWDMEHFSWRWHQPSAGIIDLYVQDDRRRQGYAKFLIVQILRYLQDQFYSLVEVQAPEGHAAILKLAQGLGFKKVDEGLVFRKEL
jgi:ribosomal protein S18 acetylase RimI-like enzyme